MEMMDRTLASNLEPERKSHILGMKESKAGISLGHWQFQEPTRILLYVKNKQYIVKSTTIGGFLSHGVKRNPK